MSDIPPYPADDWLADYLAGRDRERAQRRADALAVLTDREQQLVREFAVMGFVHGHMAAGSTEFPKDDQIMAWVLDGLLSDAGASMPFFRSLAEPDGEEQAR